MINILKNITLFVQMRSQYFQDWNVADVLIEILLGWTVDQEALYFVVMKSSVCGNLQQ